VLAPWTKPKEEGDEPTTSRCNTRIVHNVGRFGQSTVPLSVAEIKLERE
jgi:hypothetical protein